jgi:ornithine cyclodeaminase/alanine dehydrogenase-like protein (mu-crystallin family)
VDDIDHVCRAQTSLDLAQQVIGNRDFISGTLADVFLKNIPIDNSGKLRIFSPFGLGILDLAVGTLVQELGIAQQKGIILESFAPAAWAYA